MTDTTLTKEPAANPQVQEPAQSPVALSIQDLQNIRRILDVASQRGAFKPEEFQAVGGVYAKLAGFVDAAVAAAEAEAAAKKKE